MGNGINNGMDSAVKFGAGRYRQGRGVLEPVSYTHLDVYKRQDYVTAPTYTDTKKPNKKSSGMFDF